MLPEIKQGCDDCATPGTNLSYQTIKRELGKDVDDHKTSNSECLSQILFTFKRLFIKYHNRFQKSKHRAHETSPRKEKFLRFSLR